MPSWHDEPYLSHLRSVLLNKFYSTNQELRTPADLLVSHFSSFPQNAKSLLALYLSQLLRDLRLILDCGVVAGGNAKTSDVISACPLYHFTRPSSVVKGEISVGRMGFGPTYVAHIPPIVVWYNRDSLCYGVGARVAYITAKAKKS